MWGTWSRAAIAIPVLGFAMWMLRTVLDPIIEMATSGPHSSHSTVQVIGGWYGSLTLPNLTLLAGLAVAIYVLGRSVVEKRGI